jgi:S1-C subfamily serine protease
LAIAAAATTAVRAGVPLDAIEHMSGVPSLAPVLRKITPAVVNIAVTGHGVPEAGSPAKARANSIRTKSKRSPAAEQAAARREVSSAGSGVIFDAAQGLIITNNHVIAHADRIAVMLTDGRELPAKLIGTDPPTDVAVIKVQADGLTAIPLNGPERIEVGDFVFAIGNPLQLGQTVTSGIVSGLHRRNVGVAQYEDFVQTDAAIYPGNSGGALVNGRGDLVGINTAFIAPGRGNPGLGFAIPVALARSIAEQILEHGEIRRGRLGVVYDDPASVSQPDKKPPMRQSGAVIVSVDNGSAADRAGLRSGDLVIELGKAPLRDASDLDNRLALLRIGDTTELQVVRNGALMTIQATIAAPQQIARSK